VPPAIGFFGQHDLRIDDKSRVSIPARFKSVLSEQFADDDMQVVVMPSLDLNLTVLPVSEYAKVVAEYEQFSDLDEEARRLKEMMTGLATIESIDAGGRIRLSVKLREIAGLDKEVTLIGRMNHFDIWDHDRWLENEKTLLRDVRHLTQQVKQKSRDEKKA
jgi:MraZ protein